MKQIEKYKQYFTKEYLMGLNSLRIADELLEKYPLHMNQGNTILELGCGTGLSSLFISKETNAVVHAIDLWISETENAERFANWGMEGRIIPLCIDASITDFEQEKYDTVMIVDAYHYFAGKEGFFVNRILPAIKKGGITLIAVPGIREEYEEKQVETIQEWIGEEVYMFHSCSWWRNIIGTHSDIEFVNIWEMECFEQAWRDWIESGHEKAEEDEKFYNSIIEVFMLSRNCSEKINILSQFLNRESVYIIKNIQVIIVPSQKVENILNLALDASDEEKQKSRQLEVGFNSEVREWELIIKYSGNLNSVRAISSSVSELLNGYAIVIVRESQVNVLAALPEVEYVEKPKRLYFQVLNGKRVSCIDKVQDTRFSLFGQGVLVGIVDSGIDFNLEDFKNPDGTTRVRVLWDQSLETVGGERKPEPYRIGVEYTMEEINRALGINESINVQSDENTEIGMRIRTRDISGHGTAVAGIAAGSGDVYRGVAPESELIIVKMGTPRQDGFPRTTELMMGIDYVIRKAMEFGKPVAINVSFGNTYGAHNGTSLLERYIDDISGIWKSVICIGAGNEASSAGHTSGVLKEDEEEIIELAVQERQPSFGVQIWKEYVDEVSISLVSPSGVRIGPIQEILGSQSFVLNQTQVLLYYGEPSPYSTSQEIYLDFIPQGDYVNQGIWRIELRPGRIVSGQYDLWLPSEAALNRGTAFLRPTDDMTLTIPSTASRVITVGAYDALTFAYADFSGRGAGRMIAWDRVSSGSRVAGTRGITVPAAYQKPDLVAPGVDVTTVAAGGGYASFSGTSFATPFVTGSAALLMEWGIVRGNDPYLYGEKVKAYLQRGAKHLPGFMQYPNSLVGYGALCLEDSLPG